MTTCAPACPKRRATPGPNPRPLPATTTVFRTKGASTIGLILGKTAAVRVGVWHPAAVDSQILPRYVAGLVAGEKQHGVCDLPHLCKTPERGAVGVLLEVRDPFGDGRVDHLGAGHTRRDAVKSDVVLRPLDGQHLRQVDPAGFCRVVRRPHWPAPHTADGGDVHDAARPAL